MKLDRNYRYCYTGTIEYEVNYYRITGEFVLRVVTKLHAAFYTTVNFCNIFENLKSLYPIIILHEIETFEFHRMTSYSKFEVPPFAEWGN